MLEKKIIKGLSIVYCILLALSARFVYPVHAESMDPPDGKSESAEAGISMLVEVINEPQNQEYYTYYEIHDANDLNESEAACAV